MRVQLWRVAAAKPKFRLIATLVLAFMIVAQPFALTTASAAGGNVRNVQTGENFADFASAVNDVDTVSGQTLRATGNFTVNSSVTVNKSLTINGVSSTITTESTTNVFALKVADVKINGFTFVKANTAGDFRFISLLPGAIDAKIWNNSFSSSFQIGDSYNVRGLVVSPGVNGYDIRNNTFSHVRQPAYIDASTGSIRNNHTEHTKGWVVTSGSDITFTNNTWGTGSERNVLDIAIIAEASNNYPDNKVVQLSNSNNDAVVENQFGGVKVLSDAYVQPTANGKVGDNGSAWNPYTKIQDGFNRIVEGGTVHVANGAYTEKLVVTKNGTKLVGESRDGVKITPLANQYGQGLSVEGVKNVDLRNFTIDAQAGGGGYALKAHNAARLTVADVTVNGAGTSVSMGGVDINGVNGVTISNVISRNFKKNGFSFSSRFAATDPFTRNVLLSNITAANNGWAGVAFYTTNNAGTVGRSIPGITFAGANTVSGNTKGLEVVGDSDANLASGLTPRYSLSDAAGGAVDLSGINFAGNTLAHVINNQPADMSGTNARFDGKLYGEMTLAEKNDLQTKLLDKNDIAHLGSVVFADTTAPTIPTGGAPHEAYRTSNEFDFTWNESTDDAPGNVRYEFRSSQDINQVGSAPDGSGAWTSSMLDDPMIHSSGAGDGVWYWQVRAIDQSGNKSAWSDVWNMTIDTSAPTLNILNPANGEIFGGVGKEQIVVTSYLEDSLGLGQFHIDVDGAGAPLSSTATDDAGTPSTTDTSAKLTIVTIFNAADFTNGEHTINVWVTDKAGNLTQESRTIFVNNFIPGPVTGGMGGGSAADDDQTLFDQAARLSQPFAVPASFGTAATSSLAEASDDTDVLGAQKVGSDDTSTKTVAAVPTEDGWKLFGILWYWWVLLAAVLAAITTWLIAAAKRRNAEV